MATRDQGESPADRRARYLRTLAARDLWAVVGVRPGTGAEEVRRAAEARRQRLKSSPMPQDRRREELTWVDHAERVLADPRLRVAWERERDRRAVAGRPGETKAESAARAAREARLDQAAAARPEWLDMYLSSRAGAPGLLASPGVQADLDAAGAEAAGAEDAAACIARALDLRRSGSPAPALAWARRAVQIDATAHALNVLGALEREAGDLAGSERSLRASLEREPHPLRNAPGFIALAATLRALGRPKDAQAAAETVLEVDPEDRHAWRALAGALADQGLARETVTALDRSMPLDRQGAVELLRALRSSRSAAGDRQGLAVAEDALRHITEDR